MTAIARRPLGRSGLSIAPVVLGGNVFGWSADEPASHRILDAWVDAGLDAIDTADTYSIWAPGHVGGESEAVIGRWLAKSHKRDRVVICTKVGMDMKAGGKGLSAAHIRRSVEGSLRRLQTDRIDLYQAHEDDASTPLEETLLAFDALVREGKVRAIGASNFSAARLEEALATSARLGVARYESLQPHYNLVERARYEGALEDACTRHGLGVIPYFGLARGFLSGKYRSEADLGKSAVRGGGVRSYLDGHGLGVLAALDTVAQALGATPAQVALAWLIARPSITAPIASATSVEQALDLARAATLVLDRPSIELLDRASRKVDA